jgi:microcystin-dependent protein
LIEKHARLLTINFFTMTPFLGGIFLVGFNFAPQGYSMCNGQLLSISQNTALFSLLGTFYGGNGQNTFALPDLQGRVPIHQGSGAGLSSYVMGQLGGAENITLTSGQMPQHNHLLNVNSNGSNTLSPDGAYFSGGVFTGSGPNASPLKFYTTTAPNGAKLNSGTVATTGGGQPHPNIQPYLVVNFVIAMQGVFPSRS